MINLFQRRMLKGMGTRRCLSNSGAELVSSLPPNVILADMRIFEDAPKINAEPLNYLFPTLDAPTSLQVHNLLQPGVMSNISVKLEPEIFNVALRKDIVHEAIRYLRHKRRQPKKTKTISEIRGSNKKPWPQKGQGRARAGHKRSNIWRGGYKAHGPVLRSYAIGSNRKMRAQAMMITLAAKLREGNLKVFESFQMEVRTFLLFFNALILAKYFVQSIS
jgi:50S ribosomal protein L4